MKIQNVKIISEKDFKILSNDISKIWNEFLNENISDIFEAVEIASENKDGVILTKNKVIALLHFLQNVRNSTHKLCENLGINLDYRD